MKKSNLLAVKMIRPDLVLIVGSDATSLFDYFEVDSLHGLTRENCLNRIKQGGTYIDGMCNEFPNGTNKTYYLFLNQTAFTLNPAQNYSLVFHESTHYAFRKYWSELQDKEEELITEAENVAIDICRFLF
jgi:hypothetical protein